MQLVYFYRNTALNSNVKYGTCSERFGTDLVSNPNVAEAGLMAGA